MFNGLIYIKVLAEFKTKITLLYFITIIYQSILCTNIVHSYVTVHYCDLGAAEKVDYCGALTFASCCLWCLLWCLGCLANEFSCGDDCVALVKRCDRHDDCVNGEDEQECSKSNKFSNTQYIKPANELDELATNKFDRSLNLFEINLKVLILFQAITKIKVRFKVEHVL